MGKKTFEYVILVKNRPVARGKNLRKIWDEAEKVYPNEKLVIRWEPPEGILIAVFQIQKARK